MKAHARWSPRQLAACAIGASLFVCGSFVAAEASSRLYPLSSAAAEWPSPRRIAIFVPVLACLVALVWSQSRLQRGVKQGAWTAAELEPLRTILEAPVWMRLYLAGFALWVPLVAWNYHHAFFFFVMLFPLQTVTSLSQAIKQRTPSEAGHLSGSITKPLQSEHWGDAGRSGSVN